MRIACSLGRRGLLGVFLAAGVAGAADAQGADPRQPVSDLYAALRAGMRLAGAPFQKRFDQLAPAIDRSFDLDTILRTSVGLKWESLDAGSRQTLGTVFRAFTVASYAANFEKDGGERFEVLPQTRDTGGDKIVASKLVPAGGDSVRIDYVVRAGAGGWRIVDVLLDGSISRVAVQRSDFRSLLAGGGPEALTGSLKSKVAELSGGAMRL